MQIVLKRAVTINILCLLATSVYTQDGAMAALRKIHNSYNRRTAIQFTGSMKMYAKYEPLKIIDQLQSSYILRNNNFHCSIGPVSILVNNDYYVSVNNTDKLIILGRKKDLPVMAGNPVLNLQQLEQWLAEKKIQAVVSVRGSHTVLQLTDIAAISGFVSYRIEFSSGTGYMKRVVMETGAGNETGKILVLEIKYTDPLPAANASFSEKPFFSVVGSRVQLHETYRNYQLINQL